ncbi:hypothetical protein [Streptomyces sp. NPDC088261]|uniref:hypothetical protein n=1 Tax=Streptomyces sp. NPDC088261 TaxID=3365851 RepID=UPI0038026F57
MVLLLLIPVALITAFGLAGYGFGVLGRVGVRGAGRVVWLRCLGSLLGAGAVAVYTWGLLLAAGAVLAAEDGGASSSPLLPCRTPGQWERASQVIDYRVDYVPLRFVCETTGGGSFATDAVPGYVNQAVVGFALGGVVCAGAAAVTGEMAERRAGKVSGG